MVFALRRHFGEARAFAGLASIPGPHWRVIALDQRGHGFSDRTPDFSRAGYRSPMPQQCLARMDRELGLGPVVVLGHSLGGVSAYQLAARHPAMVHALVIEDIGPVVADDLSFALDWPSRAPTRAALVEALGAAAPRLHGRDPGECADGWGLAFDVAAMVGSRRQLNGDQWADWLAGRCPALVIQGARRRWLSRELARGT